MVTKRSRLQEARKQIEIVEGELREESDGLPEVASLQTEAAADHAESARSSVEYLIAALDLIENEEADA